MTAEEREFNSMSPAELLVEHARLLDEVRTLTGHVKEAQEGVQVLVADMREILQEIRSEGIPTTVTNVDMGLNAMAGLAFKWVAASIPLGVMLWFIWAVVHAITVAF